MRTSKRLAETYSTALEVLDNTTSNSMVTVHIILKKNHVLCSLKFKPRHIYKILAENFQQQTIQFYEYIQDEKKNVNLSL